MMKKLFTLKVLLAFMAIGSCATLSAQTVIKVGASWGAKQTTLQMAYDSIVPATLDGAYILELQADYDPTTEVYPITLKAKTGASATNNIVIKPATDVKKVIGPSDQTKTVTAEISSATTSLVLDDITGLSTSSYVGGYNVYSGGEFKKLENINQVNKTVTFPTGTFTNTTAATTTFYIGPAQTKAILFYGAQYVTIDGISRTDSQTGLTIKNPNSIYAQTVYFTENANYNTIKNCIIRGRNQTGAWNNGHNGTVFFGGSYNNTITNNDVCDMGDGSPYPVCAFQMTGVGYNVSNIVSENNIYNIANLNTSASSNCGFIQFGSTWNTNSHSNVILNNKFFITGTANLKVGSNVVGIGIGSSMNGVNNRIEGNTFGYSNLNNSGNSIYYMGGASGSFKVIAGLRNATCINNTITNIEFSGTTLVGIDLANSTSLAVDTNQICNNNTLSNLTLIQTGNGTLNGIYVSSANTNDVIIQSNKITNLFGITNTPGHTSTVAGINFSGTANTLYKYKFKRNTVSGLSAGYSGSTAANYVYGIRVPFNTTVVEKNMVTDLKVINSNTSGAVRGIQTAGSNVKGQLVANNIVNIGSSVTSDAFIAAMYQEAATSGGDTISIYNNTFVVSGTAPTNATKSTYAYARATGNPHKINFKNNIFSNVRTVAANESHSAINLNVTAELSSCDNNIYQFNGKLSNLAVTFADWQTLTLTDLNSVAADPQFVDLTAANPDFRLKATSPGIGTGANLLAKVPTDYNGFTRTSNDIGALASGTWATGVSTVKPAALGVYAAQKAIVITERMGQTARIYNMNGQLIQTTQLISNNENIEVSKGLYIVRIGSFSTKVLVK